MASPVSAKPGWRFGVFEVDARRGELRRSGVPLRLREQSFQILVALLENPGEIVTRDELRHLLWPSDIFVDFDHSLNTAMMKLRDALGDSTEAPIYIETIPKRGYRFIAPVSSIGDLPVRSVPNEKSPVAQNDDLGVERDARTRTAPARIQRRRKVILFAGLGITVVVAGTFFYHRARQEAFSPRTDRDAASYRIDSITTARGSFKNPAISPDGRDIAYAWNGGGGDHWDVYVQRIGSPMPHRLTYIKTGLVGFPAWSPDQTQIVFMRCNGVDDGVYTIPAVAGSEQGPERRLTSIRCQYNQPTPVAWLADSRLVMIDRCAASGLHALVLFSMDTGQKRCIADFGPSERNRRFRFSVSPDQKTIAFVPSIESPVCELFTMPISGGIPHRILQDDGACDEVMWTSDGKEIVLESERTTFPALWEVPAKGGSVRKSIYPAVGTFSQDGRRFVYEEQMNGEPHAIWRTDLARAGGIVLSNKRLIATQFPDLDAQPSPEGTRIVYASRRGGSEELWTSSATGEDPVQLTHLNTYSGTPRWSPNGERIVFDSYIPSEGGQIFIIDEDGRNLHQITQGRYMNSVPSWSRDGKSIYFTSIRSGNKEVWRHSLETGKEVQLTRHGGFNPFESYDGQTVYFSKFDEAGIWKIPIGGGEETLVIEGRPQAHYWGHWALTRQGIYFLNADAQPRARIEFLDFASRRTFPILSLEKNAVYGQPSLSATEDGKTIFYTQVDRQSVIKMMEFSR